MERLFSSCTRLNDLLASQGQLEEFGGNLQLLRELNLDVSTDEFLSAGSASTYADLFAMLGNGDTFVWLTPHTAVLRTDGKAVQALKTLEGESYGICCSVDGEDIFAVALSPNIYWIFPMLFFDCWQ
jgi:hypothetical protein